MYWIAPPCRIADEARFLWRLREDLKGMVVRLEHYARHYGEFASDCVAFKQMLRYRRRELRMLEKRIGELSQACPLFFDAFRPQNLTPVFWAFFVGEFRKMRRVSGVHCHISRSKEGFRYPQGKMLLRFKVSFILSRREPFWSQAEQLRQELLKKGYEEARARNVAWSRLFHRLMESLYLRMRELCGSCPAMKEVVV